MVHQRPCGELSVDQGVVHVEEDGGDLFHVYLQQERKPDRSGFE
jgi:hypothetical protein